MNEIGDRKVSVRGEYASNNIMRVDIEAYLEAFENLYHKDDNPSGAFPLNIAENKLNWKALRDKIQSIQKEIEIPEWVSAYTSTSGSLEFRNEIANFLEDYLAYCPINSEHLAVSSGASGVIEVSTFILGNSGDVAVFPAPCYPVYRQDMGNFGGIERYDLQTHHDLAELSAGPLLSIEHLEEAKRDLESKRKDFKFLILTSPDNPTGIIYSRTLLDRIADWCIANKIHLVVNEIYALSTLNLRHPIIAADYKNTESYESFIPVMQEKQSDYLHMWYAFSKDFGISGFRLGFVYSLNETFHKAFSNLNLTHCASNYAQWCMLEVLQDKVFLKHYIAENQRLLTNSYAIVIEVLRRKEIPYVPAKGSLFVWVDLSKYLTNNSQQSEDKFWLKLYNETGILLTPGNGFGHSKNGYFRIVYPCVSASDLRIAMKRFESFIDNHKPSHDVI